MKSVYPEKRHAKLKVWWFKNLVLFLGVTSSLFVFFYKFLFSKRNEIFPQAFELGELFYNLSFAILSSAIFYYFVVHLKNRDNKMKVKGLINMRFEQISLMHYLIYNDIKKVCSFPNPPQKVPETLEVFKSVCSKMKLTDIPPPYFTGIGFIQFSNWYDYFENQNIVTKYNIDILYHHSSFLNSEIIQLMHDTLHSTLYQALRQYKIEQTREKYAIEFDSISHLLFDYFILLSKFKKDSWQ